MDINSGAKHRTKCYNQRMLIGYARVSTTAQNLDRQIAAINDLGVTQIYREKISGKSLKGRPELEKAVDVLGTNDVLVIAEWDRATRSMADGISIIQRIADRGASVRVLDKPWLDLTTPMGKGILAFLSALAEDERVRITRRANQGRILAKAKGVRFGRKPKLTSHQISVAVNRVASGDSFRAVAKDMGVHHATISRLMK
ncbi:recombinase family protein [uncultured Sulfitobacter sp.]|uniref:recombinase family protein n=1 Tax=uncultured Sulfitobacter sp. TaxID=191468 RepID=UPI0026127B68|nr:recombinase family protein [uncultured Sulfitobacter sp.]